MPRQRTILRTFFADAQVILWSDLFKQEILPQESRNFTNSHIASLLKSKYGESLELADILNLITWLDFIKSMEHNEAF